MGRECCGYAGAGHGHEQQDAVVSNSSVAAALMAAAFHDMRGAGVQTATSTAFGCTRQTFSRHLRACTCSLCFKPRQTSHTHHIRFLLAATCANCLPHHGAAWQSGVSGLCLRLAGAAGETILLRDSAASQSHGAVNLRGLSIRSSACGSRRRYARHRQFTRCSINRFTG